MFSVKRSIILACVWAGAGTLVLAVMARFHITIIRPREYPHSDCFTEIAETLFHALQRLGHTVTQRHNRVERDATTILFGAHLLTRPMARALPPSVVVYNLEQLGGSRVPSWYMDLAARTQIWEYTPLNLLKWRQVPCIAPPRLVRIGYVPELSRIVSAPQQDIDVLFYGAVTDRRRRILDALTAEGVRVHVGFGIYGMQRDALIARSRLVLNLHAEGSRVFEVVRVSYLLANAKAVVAEDSDDFGALADAVAVCSYDSAIAVCQRLLHNDGERRALEARAFSLFAARPQQDILLAAGIPQLQRPA